jgi:hypothetical protein
MGDLLQPWHLIVIIGFIALIVAAVKLPKALAKPMQSISQGPEVTVPDPTLPALKYCTECGQQIKRQADICPLCGCRQSGV